MQPGLSGAFLLVAEPAVAIEPVEIKPPIKKRERKTEMSAQKQLKIKRFGFLNCLLKIKHIKKGTSEPKSRRSQQTNSMKTVIFNSENFHRQ